MSGTSADGVDVALVRTDGASTLSLEGGVCVPYEDELRGSIHAALAAAQDQDAPDAALFADLEKRLTRAHHAAAQDFIKEKGQKPAVIGFHGQTLRHCPHEGWCWQLGDGALLHTLTGCKVVGRFRDADIAAGGEGAPLTPLFHRALAAQTNITPPFGVINIGGVSNMTLVLGDDDIRATDCGIGMALIDDLCREFSLSDYGLRDAIIAQGTPDAAFWTHYREHDFFKEKFWQKPRALDRQDFHAHLTPRLTQMPFPEGLCALASCLAQGLRLALEEARTLAKGEFPVILSGGGRHLVYEALKKHWQGIKKAEEAGWQGDLLEAQAFAWLAARALYGLPLSLPHTTGVKAPATGGVIYG